MQNRQRAFHVVGRIETHKRVQICELALPRARHLQLVLRRMMHRKCVQHAGNVQRNARAHQHIPHACQHRSVD